MNSILISIPKEARVLTIASFREEFSKGKINFIDILTAYRDRCFFSNGLLRAATRIENFSELDKTPKWATHVAVLKSRLYPPLFKTIPANAKLIPIKQFLKKVEQGKIKYADDYLLATNLIISNQVATIANVQLAQIPTWAIYVAHVKDMPLWKNL